MRLCEAIDEAISCAEQADQPFRHGCVIMSGKKVVSNGFNHGRKHIGTYSVHAEMDALWKLNSDAYDNLKAVIVRVSKTGYLGNSRPCTMCMAALKQHGVKTIVYSSIGGRIVMEKIDERT
jgi:deoxycytidylate deaminase